jgi:transcriptional regulator with XRE-family HTH domain
MFFIFLWRDAMFYDILTRLCAEKGASVTPYTVEVLGFSNATATGWKKGKKPGGKAIKKIADHFGVSIDTLLAGSASAQSPEGEIVTLKALVVSQQKTIEALSMSIQNLSNDGKKGDRSIGAVINNHR